MDLTPTNVLLQDVQVPNLLAYVELLGWQRIPSASKWLVYTGPVDDHGQPLELVLPARASAPDFSSYLANAINLLGILQDEAAETTVRRISNYNSDVLYVHNLETGDYNSLSLSLAAAQTRYLRNFVSFAASSQRHPKPYFLDTLDIGNRMVDQFRFGHTVRGSFGFTIESPLLHSGQTFTSQTPLSQLDLEETQPVSIAPFERRIMERIVRGFQHTQEAVAKQDPEVLIREYASGFNANMCQALISLARGETLPITYSVEWSPRFAPDTDIRDFHSIRLHETSYNILRVAAAELRNIAPEYVTIQGLVTHLGSETNPMDDMATSRSVIIRWQNRPNNAKPLKVSVTLNKHAYTQALDAHRTWSTVEVTGIIERAGSLWHLLDPGNFQVLNLPTSYEQPSLL